MRQLINWIQKNGIFLVIFLLGLTPLIWFYKRPGVLITGSDTNFPLNPDIWFRRRFFVWNSVGQAGSDFSSSVAGTFFHLIQYLPFKLGFSLQRVEIISVIFWFMLIVFAAYFFARAILPYKKIPQLVFVVLYAFNIYLFNSWENIKVSNLSLTAAIPIGLGILQLLRDRKIGLGRALLFSLVCGVIISGGGINPAYIICFFLILFIFTLGEILTQFSKETIIFRLCELFYVSITILLVNSFWILPTINFIFTNISGSGSIDKIGYNNWIDSISENTSLVNILKMQGAWDWYSFDGITKSPLYIPYSVNYFFNPVFIIFSFMLPTIAFLSFIFKSAKRSYLYVSFAIMLILAVFLGAGTHPPTDTLFRFLSSHIPFFTLFRSPWYIFTPLLTLSLAGLVSLLLYNFGKKLSLFFAAILIVGNLIYCYPLVIGKIFRPASHDNFYVKFPSYVYSTEKWLATADIKGRIISYPDNEIERFSWGYNAIDSILGLFSDKEVLFSALNSTDSSISKLMSEFYLSLQKGELQKMQNLAQVLNAEKIFYKYDQETLSKDVTSELDVFPKDTFGKWTFYSLPGSSRNKIYTSSNIFLSFPYEKSARILSVIGNSGITVNPQDQIVSIFNRSDIKTGKIIYATNSQFDEAQRFNYSTSNLKDRLLKRDLSKVIYNVNITDEGDYMPLLEKYDLIKFGIDITQNVDVELDGKSTKLKVKSTDDSYVYFSPVHLSTGGHRIAISLNNVNLISDKNYNKAGEGIVNVDVTNGEKTFSLENKSTKDLTINFPIDNPDQFSTYMVQLQYRQIYGENAAVLTEQDSKTSVIKNQTERLPNYPEWGNFSFYYEPIKTKSSIEVRLLAPYPRDVLGTKILYKNLSVNRVFTNDLFLINKPENVVTRESITYKELSPVLYEGEVKDSKGWEVINFLENYSPNWKIEILNTDESFKPNIMHFTSNYYANGWLVSKLPKNFKFRIYYQRQNLLKIGYIISSITVIAVVIIYIYRKKYEK